MKEKEMFFFIADISGYTSHMLTNNTACEHAKISISLLIETLIKQIRIPLEIAKLEGDAIFLYLEHQLEDRLWLAKKIFTFFKAFERKVHELKLSTVCQCGGCQNIEKLQLKVIAHYGNASLHKIGKFKELAGVDIIILHRLLKNHVPEERYFLLTEAAYHHMLVPEDVKVSKMREIYEDIGTIPIYVCDPPRISEVDLPAITTPLLKFKHWLLLHFGKKRPGHYRNLPDSVKELQK